MTMLTATPIDTRLLTLTQWLSPAYPVGAFAYSHGLEQAIREGWVLDAESLGEWLAEIAAFGSGRSDAIWIWLAWRAESEADALMLDAEARAYAAAAERLREGARQGEAFARVTAAVWNLALPPMLLPVALGRAARLMDLPPEAVAALYLQAFLGNLAAAAQRLMPLGQTDAQGVLAGLNQTCLRVAAEAAGAGLEDISSTAFLSDIAAMRHETLQPRLFQS
ncbi:urease accessory protein UreF [Cribrihabitans neustonicus]|uniref:urease accessory protein UreF n=1 Tax=Cribrihabitans neustonicus TaxID=1429085 RepID=UPI003B59FBB2